MFAPGWTYEQFAGNESLTKQRELWSQFEERLTAQRICTLPLLTSFNLGYGRRYMVQGNVVSTARWANLSAQSLLPTFPVQSELTPYFLQRGVAFLFPGLSIGLEDACAFNGGQCLSVTTRLTPEAQEASPDKLPRAFFRLMTVHVDLKGPCCISVVVGHRGALASRLQGTLLLVLNNEPTGVRYIELPLQGDETRDSGSHSWVPLSQTTKVLNTMKEKYGVAPSVLLRSDEMLDRYVARGAPTPQLRGPSRRDKQPQEGASVKFGGETAASDWFLNFRPLATDPVEAGVVWTRHWFVLAHSELRQRQLHEIRLAVAPPLESGGDTKRQAKATCELLIGELALYHPSHLVDCPTWYVGSFRG
jgi:hypothetical protein